MPFDLAQLDTRTASESGVDMPIPRGPNGPPLLDDAGKPITIRLLGPNSEKFRAVVRARQAIRTDMAASGIPRTPDDNKAEDLAYLTAITVGWSDNFTVDGAQLAFTPDNIRRLWTDGRWGWLAAVAMQFAFSEANFLALSRASPAA